MLYYLIIITFACMQLNKEKAEFLKNVIEEWQSQQLITQEQSQELKDTIVVRKFDWRQVTIYAFIIAVVCSVLSIIVLLADKPLRELIEKFTQLTDFGISCILTVTSLLVFYFTKRRFQKHQDTPFSNQSFLLFGAFLSLSAIAYWAKTLHVFHNNYSFIFLLASMMYVGQAVYFKSKVIWVLSLLMLAFAYGLFTVLLSNDANEAKFLGMNFPMRFLPFSIMITGFLLIINKVEIVKSFYKIHYVISLLFLYISLWLISIFGNYNSYERWNQVSQTQFILFDLLLFAISTVGMYVGLKRNDHILGNISLSFFILNLITRYFEYFWEPLHKSIFFMILAFVFWFIGSRAEKLWNLKFLEEK